MVSSHEMTFPHCLTKRPVKAPQPPPISRTVEVLSNGYQFKIFSLKGEK